MKHDFCLCSLFPHRAGARSHARSHRGCTALRGLSQSAVFHFHVSVSIRSTGHNVSHTHAHTTHSHLVHTTVRLYHQTSDIAQNQHRLDPTSISVRPTHPPVISIVSPSRMAGSIDPSLTSLPEGADSPTRDRAPIAESQAVRQGELPPRSPCRPHSDAEWRRVPQIAQ